jgi:hypothetical protein
MKDLPGRALENTKEAAGKREGQSIIDQGGEQYA